MANPLKSETLRQAKRTPHEVCADWNAARERSDVHWFVHDDQVCIGWARQLGYVVPQAGHIMERDRSGFTAHDWAELNAYLERMGSTVRYASDGARHG